MKTLLISTLLALCSCASASQAAKDNVPVVSGIAECQAEARLADAGTNLATYNACMKGKGLH